MLMGGGGGINFSRKNNNDFGYFAIFVLHEIIGGFNGTKLKNLKFPQHFYEINRKPNTFFLCSRRARTIIILLLRFFLIDTH